MPKSIKVNNQTIVKVLETIDKNKDHYPELWEIISGKKFDKEEGKENSLQKPKVKFIGNLDFLNLKKVESPKLFAELTERINRGEIKLNVFDCCYLMQCFGFIRQNIEGINTKESEKNKPLALIQTQNLDLFIMMLLHLLKKDNLLCSKHHKLIEEVEKKEIMDLKNEEK